MGISLQPGGAVRMCTPVRYLVPILHGAHFLLQELSHASPHAVADVRNDVLVLLAQVPELYGNLHCEKRKHTAGDQAAHRSRITEQRTRDGGFGKLFTQT